MLSALQRYMLCFVGLPYIWGGDDPVVGFDCSGLAQEFLAAAGKDFPGDQNAQALYDLGKKAGWAPGVRGCGALCFYGSSLTHITHVAMMFDESVVVEAGGGGSKTTSAAAAAAQNAYIRMRPHDRRADLVAILMPPYAKA